MPASPVFCLDAVSKDSKAVLILDQLDAVRWTNSHSRTALEVCKEMIRELESVNKNRNKKITLVFVCRTFDLKNDRGIKALFSQSETEDQEFHSWTEVVIGELNDEIVKDIVGDTYPTLSKKLQTLLKTPSNLYIWTNIEEKIRANDYRTSSDLIKQWWEQLLYYYEKLHHSPGQLIELKNYIVKNIDRTGKLMIPEQLLASCSILCKEYLLSNGMLFLGGNQIGFVHQSLYDYFSMEKMFNRLIEGTSIFEIIGNKDDQTPMRRYHLQMLFQNLLEFDINLLIRIGKQLLHSQEVRFYMKYVFFEVLGQTEIITKETEEFIYEHLSHSFWKNHLIDAVLINNPKFISLLIQDGYILRWLESGKDRDTALILLRSVNTAIPNEITSLVYSFAFQDIEFDNKIYNTLCWNIEEDSEDMFKFRLEILEKRPQLWGTYLSWNAILNKNPKRAILLLDALVKNKKNNIKDMHKVDQKVIKKFVEVAHEQAEYVWNLFMPFLARSTYNNESIHSEEMDFWATQQ
ncbi:MAG: hypothetical protein SCJ93_13785, partial [Bacillota bacterium]|nr:hypothetical protein [Bacillota bacterium]